MQQFLLTEINWLGFRGFVIALIFVARWLLQLIGKDYGRRQCKSALLYFSRISLAGC